MAGFSRTSQASSPATPSRTSNAGGSVTPSRTSNVSRSNFENLRQSQANGMLQEDDLKKKLRRAAVLRRFKGTK